MFIELMTPIEDPVYSWLISLGTVKSRYLYSSFRVLIGLCPLASRRTREESDSIRLHAVNFRLSLRTQLLVNVRSTVASFLSF